KADLDFDQRSTTTESFAQPAAGQTSPLVKETTSQETFAGPGAASAAGGVLGTNPGQTTTGNAAASANNYSKNSADRSFAVGKVTEQVKSAPGKVTRLSVAVLLDDKVKVPSDQINNLVTAAAGLDTKRGDVVSVQAMTFDHSAAEAAAKEQKAAADAKSKTQLMNLVRTVGVLLIVLVALFLAWRSAKKGAVTRHPLPGVLSAGPVPADALQAALAAMGAGTPAVGPGAATGAGGGLGAAAGLDALEQAARFERALPSAPDVNDELAELIDRQPDEVASILRGWLADRRS